MLGQGQGKREAWAGNAVAGSRVGWWLVSVLRKEGRRWLVMIRGGSSGEAAVRAGRCAPRAAKQVKPVEGGITLCAAGWR